MKEPIAQASRRDFLRTLTVGAVGLGIGSSMLSACTNAAKPVNIGLATDNLPEITPKAVDGKPLKVGLVGCGSRGTGAVLNFMEAGNNLEVVAIGDVFPDRMEECRNELANQNIQIPDENCFIGFDAYKQVIDSDIDVVLLCTPPAFRADHFEYAIQANKHVFLEKPCAVDPVGARRMLVLAKQAQSQNLAVISGTIRRSQKDCIETYKQVANGAIGQIVSAHVSRMEPSAWIRKREPQWTDMEYMLRNWINFCWLSGDIVVEQFIHEIDLMSWFTGDRKPVRAEAIGARQRRQTGDLYDMFSIEYQYENGMRAHCTTRQINGCDNQKHVLVYGTEGYTNCFDTIYNLDGTVKWKYDGSDVPNPFVQEHVRLINAIRTSSPLNDVETHVRSTLLAIMGRQSAYTGTFVTWDDIFNSDIQLGPEEYAFGPVPGIEEVPPLCGAVN